MATKICGMPPLLRALQWHLVDQERKDLQFFVCTRVSKECPSIYSVLITFLHRRMFKFNKNIPESDIRIVQSRFYHFCRSLF